MSQKVPPRSGTTSKFFVVVYVPGESSTTLAEYVFQHALMKFGLCYIVALDDGIPFKGDFVAMWNALYFNHDILANNNCKGLIVKYFHYFLNKVITIAIDDR